MENIFKISLFKKVEEFILTLNPQEQAKISSSLSALGNKKFDAIYVKQLRGEIKELRVKKYRLIFFIYQNTVFVSGIFYKQSNRTPKKEIEMAEKYYKIITKQ